MPWALNQTPPTGAAAFWTWLQLALHPENFRPEVPVSAYVCGSCGSSGGCGCSNGCWPPGGPGPWNAPGCCTPCFPPTQPCIITATNPFPCCSAWTAAQSGNGTNYTICGLIQQSAADFAIPFSWITLQSPGYVTDPLPPGGLQYYRQLTFQRGSDNTQWRIKYSARAKFTGGTPGPTQTPSATDERIILGGGTDASPTFGTFLPIDASYRMQAAFYDAGGLIPGFYLVTYPLGNPTPNACFLLDALQPGSYPVDIAGFSLEQDPVVIYQATGTGTLDAMTLSSEVTGPLGWLNYGRTIAPAQSFLRLPATFMAVYDSAGDAQSAIPVGLNQTVLADDIDVGRSTYVRRAALGGTTGEKGDASGWLWNAVLGATSGQLIGQSVGGRTQPLYWISLGDVLLRWDGLTPTVLK